MKAIFLDRDGTFIKDKHYLHKPKDVEYVENAFNALKQMQNLGFELVVVTNQSGVGRGKFPIEDVHRVHEKIQIDALNFGMAGFLDFQICPHSPDDNCECRKPLPFLINEACERFGINKSLSYMIGDKLSDVSAGETAGLRHNFLLKSEYHQEESYSNLFEILKQLD